MKSENCDYVYVLGSAWYADQPISDYLSAGDMLQAGLIDKADYARRLTIEIEANRKQQQKQIESLLSEIAALEAETKK